LWDETPSGQITSAGGATTRTVTGSTTATFNAWEGRAELGSGALAGHTLTSSSRAVTCFICHTLCYSGHVLLCPCLGCLLPCTFQPASICWVCWRLCADGFTVKCGAQCVWMPYIGHSLFSEWPLSLSGITVLCALRDNCCNQGKGQGAPCLEAVCHVAIHVAMQDGPQ
jgi:hypothetical protein